MIGAIVLAAGRSRRFGDDKRKARLPNNKLIVQQTVENVLAVFDDVLLTLRAEDDAFLDELSLLLPDKKLRIFLAPDSALGMGHSLANSIDELRHWDGAFVFLGDMPFVDIETLQRLKTALESDTEDSSRIIVPVHEGQNGHPVGFGKDHFSALANLTGDQGAKPVLQSQADAVIKVSVEDAGVLKDVDRPEDIQT